MFVLLTLTVYNQCVEDGYGRKYVYFVVTENANLDESLKEVDCPLFG